MIALFSFQPRAMLKFAQEKSKIDSYSLSLLMNHELHTEAVLIQSIPCEEGYKVIGLNDKELYLFEMCI
jgi:hypothetical protein